MWISVQLNKSTLQWEWWASITSILTAQCGKPKITLSHEKISWKQHYLILIELLNHIWFHEFFFKLLWKYIFIISTLWTVCLAFLCIQYSIVQGIQVVFPHQFEKLGLKYHFINLDIFNADFNESKVTQDKNSHI